VLGYQPDLHILLCAHRIIADSMVFHPPPTRVSQQPIPAQLLPLRPILPKHVTLPRIQPQPPLPPNNPHILPHPAPHPNRNRQHLRIPAQETPTFLIQPANKQNRNGTNNPAKHSIIYPDS
jgi:hypothetical protein